MDMSILLSIFIFLAAASIFVPLAKISGLGSVIGYLAAGVLIGPSVLGLIKDPETVLHFSEFGVVMMLFLIGLELKPRELWDMRAKLIGLGGLQVSLTLCALLAVLMLIGWAFGTAVSLAMALSLSSTAVAIQILQDRQILNTQTGKSAFSVLLFQDIIVIAMIAVIPLLSVYVGAEGGHDAYSGDGHGAQPMSGLTGIWSVIAIIGVFGGMIFAGRFLLTPLFKLIARSHVRETFTAIALGLVFGAAVLMNWLGLSAALGTFIAGVVLADSDYRHQLERDIEPFKALLLGLFFMSVGMSMNFETILQAPHIILGGALGLMTLKFGVLWLIGRVFGLPSAGNLLFALLLCQAGEFGFVLFQFIRTEGLMSAELVTQASAIIAITMAMTPLLLIAYDKLIAPRFAGTPSTGDSPAGERKQVIVLGFGRVGQVASRLLRTQDIDATLIDHDGDHISFVHQFGNRVFFGDAGDIDLLRLAGAETADLIILAIDDAPKTTRIAADLKEAFPDTRIVARARNRTHMFDLMALDVDYIERETVRGALAMGRSALQMLGYSAAVAQELSDDFLTYDVQLIDETWEHRNDPETLIQKAKSGREFIKRTLNADRDRQNSPAKTDPLSDPPSDG